jgi:hypothetical protein
MTKVSFYRIYPFPYKYHNYVPTLAMLQTSSFAARYHWMLAWGMHSFKVPFGTLYIVVLSLALYTRSSFSLLQCLLSLSTSGPSSVALIHSAELHYFFFCLTFSLSFSLLEGSGERKYNSIYSSKSLRSSLYWFSFIYVSVLLLSVGILPFPSLKDTAVWRTGIAGNTSKDVKIFHLSAVYSWDWITDYYWLSLSRFFNVQTTKFDGCFNLLLS